MESYLSPYGTTANSLATTATTSATSESQGTSMAASTPPKEPAATFTAVPNPFNSECTIRLRLATATSQAVVAVYDAQGRLVQVLLSGSIEAHKNYLLVLKADNLSPGTYNIRLTTDTEAVYQRVVLAK